jgi:hypothetical protein
MVCYQCVLSIFEVCGLYGLWGNYVPAQPVRVAPAQNYTIHHTIHKLQISIKYIATIPYQLYMLQPEIISRLGYITSL